MNLEKMTDADLDEIAQDLTGRGVLTEADDDLLAAVTDEQETRRLRDSPDIMSTRC